MFLCRNSNIPDLIRTNSIFIPYFKTSWTGVGTHKEYDKIDVQSISFDTAILTNKK